MPDTGGWRRDEPVRRLEQGRWRAGTRRHHPQARELQGGARRRRDDRERLRRRRVHPRRQRPRDRADGCVRHVASRRTQIRDLDRRQSAQDGYAGWPRFPGALRGSRRGRWRSHQRHLDPAQGEVRDEKWQRGAPMRSVLAAGVLVAALQWTPQTSGVAANLRGISAVNEHVAWASGSGATVLRTTDGGATWTKLAITTDRVDFRDIDAIDERTAYVLSIGAGATSRIYKTSDAGEHWDLQLANQDPKIFLDAMSFWDATHGIAVSDTIDGHFVIFMTEDGKSWSQVPADRLPPAQPNEGFFAASGTNI